jgi:subtilisin family serine protease
MMRTCSRRRVLTLLSLLVFLVVPGLSAWAAEVPAPRAWAPVQYGFQPNAPLVPAHAQDHVLVQLTSSAQGLSRIPARLSYLQAVPGRVTGLANLDRVFTDAGVTSLRRPFIVLENVAEEQRLGLDRWLRVELAPGSSAVAMVERLSRMPEVQNATLDYFAFPEVVPPDPMHAMHWGHNNTGQLLSYNWTNNNHETGSPVGTPGFDTNAQTAWDGTQGFGSSSVIIAIIDSGVQAAHPDLLQVTGWDFGDNDSNPDDNSSQAGHGTACSGIAAARTNSLGTAGIAAGCSIMPLKVANSAGTMSFTSIQNALMYAADHGANVISMSLGAAITSDPATDNAITYAWNAGCVILAATGNENKSTISYPAIHSLVIGVGAASPCGERKRSSNLSTEVNPGVSTDPNGYTCDGERWWGSNYGTATAGAAGAVDVIAPTILPTTDRLGAAGYDPGDYSKWFNGTSCATPYAAGVCALIKSKNPSWTNAQIRDQLRNTAQDVMSVESAAGWDRYAGYGMVDAAAAVGGGGGGGDVITVTAPNGGETLTAGTSTNITWTWSGSFSTVNIDYSTNGGSTWTAAATGTANDGSQAWTVPSTATSQGRVRVSGGTATDMSNANFTITVGGGSYASLPYTTSFAATFDANWTTAVTNDGRVRLLTTNTPHSGTYHMVMDDAVSGSTFSQTEARMGLNLAGQTQVALTFWWKDFGDETHTQDGVYFSNNGGASYVKVYNLNGGSFSDNTWRLQSLDLDALAASAGLSLTSTFVVKFQQYDDYPVATDGFAIDDISVTAGGGGGGAITAETESNNTSGTANGPVGTGVGVAGAISSASDQDFFYFDVSAPGNINVNLAIGSSADLDWFLYNSAMTEVARGYSTANPEVGNYNATATGRYYLMVDGYLSATSSYTLTVNGGLANDIPLQKVVDTGKPVVTDLLPNIPNPFRGGTAFQFALARAGHVSLDVFDASGRLVTRVVDREFDAGVHKVDWEGRRGTESVPPGVYFYRFTTPGFTQTRKMIVLPG